MRLDPGAWSRLPMAPVDFWSWTAFACVALLTAYVVWRVRPDSPAWKICGIAGAVGAFGMVSLLLTGGVDWSA